MKKIILALLISFTALSADYIINPDGTLIPQTTQSTTTPPAADTWVETPLPTEAFNVLDYGLEGDGITDDSAALKELAKNTNVTNWYFPAGYTFRLYGISIPSHIVAIYGGGTMKTISKDIQLTQGVFFQTKNPATSLIIDGLNFTYDDTWYTGSNGNYGAITTAKMYHIENIEIRNCTFTGNATNEMNAITLIGNREAGGLAHINIHNNTFLNIPRAGIEILKRNTSDHTYRDGVEDVNIYNNYFDASGARAGWKCAISFSGVGKPCSAYNNTIKNHHWDFELANCKDITLRNNYTWNASDHFISITSPKTIVEDNINYVYDNHFESPTASVHPIYGSSTQIYHNFIKGRVWHQRGIGGHFYENTIVGYSGVTTSPVSLSNLESATENSVLFENNDIYDGGSANKSVSISSTARSDSIIRKNNIYRTNGNDCIANGTDATVTGNTCTQNYTGKIPTLRTGAGLLP